MPLQKWHVQGEHHNLDTFACAVQSRRYTPKAHGNFSPQNWLDFSTPLLSLVPLEPKS